MYARQNTRTQSLSLLVALLAVLLLLPSCLSLPPESKREASRGQGDAGILYTNRSDSIQRFSSLPLFGLKTWDDPAQRLSRGRQFWPLYSYEERYRGDAVRELNLLGGLLRWQGYSDPISGRAFSILGPLIHSEKFAAQSLQRFWPLYSWKYRSQGDKLFELDFASSLIRYRHAERLSYPPAEIFLPIQFQTSSTGADLRLLWGFLRIKKDSTESRFGSPLLIYSHNDPSQYNFKILGGLLGYKKKKQANGNSHSLNIAYFWQLEI